MKITHIALWTQRLEEMKSFYTTYFDGVAGPKYENPTKGFTSYFIRFKGDTTLEIMARKDITTIASREEHIGLCHLAFSVADREEVDRLTERIRKAGYPVMGEPRITGDGFYESIIGDTDCNRIEIVALK